MCRCAARSIAGPGDFEFEILDADPRRVKRLKIHQPRARMRRTAARGGERRAKPRPIPRQEDPPPEMSAHAPAIAPEVLVQGRLIESDRRSKSWLAATPDGEPASAVPLRSGTQPLVSTELTQTREGSHFRASPTASSSPGTGERRAIAFVAGAVGALALPPFDFFPAMAVPMMAAVWLIDGSATAAGRRALDRSIRAVGVRGGMVVGLRLFCRGPVVAGRTPSWSRPTNLPGRCRSACSALPAGLAFFRRRALRSPACSGRRARRASSLSRSALASANGCAAVVLTGFPWNEFGMALGGNLVLAQFASIAGLHGLTILTVAIFAAPATLADEANGALARRGRSCWRSSLWPRSPPSARFGCRPPKRRRSPG